MSQTNSFLILCVSFSLYSFIVAAGEVKLLIENNLYNETVHIRDLWMSSGMFQARGSSWFITPGMVGIRSFYRSREGNGVKGSLLLQIGDDRGDRFVIALDAPAQNTTESRISVKWLQNPEDEEEGVKALLSPMDESNESKLYEEKIQGQYVLSAAPVVGKEGLFTGRVNIEYSGI